jgi:ectoine hydroxylase-related dioxygenase (phytanoyl-CoA dioxygenase family)
MTQAPTLPANARETYEREGWLVVRRFFDPKRVKALIAAAEVLEASARELTRDTTVRGVVYELQTKSGRKGDEPVAPGALRKIGFPSKNQGAYSALRSDPRLLAAAEELGLSQPRVHLDQVNYKLPRVGTGFPFHQDASFLVGKSRGRIERLGGLNLVIALDRADAENGGFEVLGRTHTSGLVDVPYDTSTMNEGVFDESRRELVPMEPGDAVFFHPHLAHGSGPNRSDRPRRIVTMWLLNGPRAH